MSLVTPSESQLRVAKNFTKGATFLEGPAGTGKTTAAIMRVLNMLDVGVSADSILVLVPQRTLARPYLAICLASLISVALDTFPGLII